MFAKLPDLLGKNFVIGYLLPAFTFVVLNYYIDGAYNFLPNNIALSYISTLSLTEQITIIVLFSFIVGILLLIFNRDIIVLLEGYEKFNPFRLLHGLQKSRYKKLQQDITGVETTYLALIEQNKAIPPETQARYQELLEQRSRDYPDQEEFVLPTAFGNTLRAFETYAREMYGADAIPIWTRLLAVIPEDYRQFIDTAKTQVDFWVNTWFVITAICLIYLGNLIYYRQLKLILLPFICVLVAYIASQKAKTAAVSWGNFVKAAFDLFLGDLQKQLGITVTESDPGSDAKSDRKMWQNYSQALLYNKPELMPEKSITPPSEPPES